MYVVLLSPPGRGALSVIHAGGAGAPELCERLLGRSIPRDPVYGWLRHRGERLDEVLVRRVDGMTGEPCVEITGHGGTAAPARLLEAFREEGAEVLEAPGLIERAVARGAMDRVQAEAWSLLPGAATLRAARMLEDQARGALSRAIAAGVAAAELLATARLGRALATPLRLVLAGPPNAGKSTLFNALAGTERAVVSPEAGTTRDPVRTIIAFAGIPFELVDTAGDADPRDEVEAAAAERARAEREGADLILWLGADSPPGRSLRLYGKADLGGVGPGLAVSGKTGEGLPELGRAVLRELGLDGDLAPGAPCVFTARQEAALREGRPAL
jgi:tRNA modification GTPase